MKNRCLLLLILINFSATSQNWIHLSNGTNGAVRTMYADSTEGNLYVGGNFWKADGIPTKAIARWDGVNWEVMGVGAAINNYPVVAIKKYKGEIYTGVFCTENGGLRKWNGIDWDTVGLGVNRTVWTMEVYDNELLIGGTFDTVGGLPCDGFAKWDGNNYIPIGMPSIFIPPSAVTAICIYKGEIYLGGNFYTAAYPNDTIQNIIRYDGNNWKSVGGGMHGGMDAIECFAVYKNELYAAGTFTKAHGNTGNYIQKWDGTNWSEVGGGVIGYGGVGNGQIHDMIIYHNELYAVGVFSYAGGIPAQYIAKWDGTNWCGLGSIFDNTIGSLGVYNDMLYIGGGFSTIDGDTMNFIAKWIGGSYVDTCGNITSINEINNKESNITVFPNPSNGSYTLQFNDAKFGIAELNIFNILGKTVYSEKLNTNSGINHTNINITEFPDGIYLLGVVINENSSYYAKIIKQ